MRSRTPIETNHTMTRNTRSHHSTALISSPERPARVNELTFAHSGTVVNDKGSDIFFVRHGESCFVVVEKGSLRFEVR
jgi:hypothetical protein